MMTEHGRSIMKRNGLSLLLALITLLTACAPIQQENPFASIPTVEGTQVANPEKTPTQGLPEEIPGNPQGIDPPVTISFVKNQWTSDAEIITVGLTGDLNYSAIPVKRETVLKSLPAIDQDGSVFLLYGTNYGANSTFFSRLGIDGSIDTINVPVSGPIVDTVWIGNRLFINRKTLLIVNTDMRIEEQPPINKLPDGNSGLGFMGLANETEKSLIWFSSQPFLEGDKQYAFYRTYNAKTGETYEGKLEIPYSIPDYTPTNNPDDRLGTIVMGIDTASKHVVLCYGQYSKDDNSLFFILELRDPANGEVVSIEQTCCNNTVITSSGAFYSSNLPVESCGLDIVRSYSDGSDLINFSSNTGLDPDLRRRFWQWHGTNGDYWIVMDQENLTILDNSGNELHEYKIPDLSLKDCSAPYCSSPSFLISQE